MVGGEAFTESLQAGDATANGCFEPNVIAVVENLDGFAFDKFVGEAKVRHVRPSGGTINREETKTSGGNSI